MRSGVYIHFSNHPLHVKRSVTISLFLRALRICDPQSLDREIDFLRCSFSIPGYPRHVLDVALSKAWHTFNHDSSPKGTPHLPVLSQPYTDIYSLRPPYFLNYRLIFRQVNTAATWIHASPSPNPLVGTYAIPRASLRQETQQRPFC